MTTLILWISGRTKKKENPEKKQEKKEKKKTNKQKRSEQYRVNETSDVL